MIPDLVDIGSLWEVLPPGIHDATMDEVERSFAYNDQRQELFAGFQAGVMALRRAGCRTVYLDGSFVTGKPKPGDFDVCWDPSGVDPSRLDPVLLDFSDGRKAQKEKYRGEFFPSGARADSHLTFVDFFQVDKLSGEAKGIARIRLSFTGRGEH